MPWRYQPCKHNQPSGQMHAAVPVNASCRGCKHEHQPSQCRLSSFWVLFIEGRDSFCVPARSPRSSLPRTTSTPTTTTTARNTTNYHHRLRHDTTNYHHDALAELAPTSVGKVFSGRPVFLWIFNTTNYHHDALAELAPTSVGKVFSVRPAFLWILNTTNYHHDALAELAPTSVGKCLVGGLFSFGFSTLQTTTTMHLLNSPRRQ
jgi:hypothetical protein